MGFWSDLINAKKICRDAVIQVDQRELKDSGPEQAARGLAASGVACGGQTVEEIVQGVGSLVDMSRGFRSSAFQRSECTPVWPLAILFSGSST